MKDLQQLAELFKGSKKQDLADMLWKKKKYLINVINWHVPFRDRFKEEIGNDPFYLKQESENWVKEIKIYKKNK